MALSEFEIFKVKKAAKGFCALRNKNYPPDQLYIDYRLDDQSLCLFEVRPQWKEPSNKIETPIAKFSYVKSKKVWKLYWQRRDLEWHLYDILPSAVDLDDLFAEVWHDAYGCFWG